MNINLIGFVLAISATLLVFSTVVLPAVVIACVWELINDVLFWKILKTDIIIMLSSFLIFGLFKEDEY